MATLRQPAVTLPTAPDSVPDPKPFLKWAGGKRQLLPVLRRFYPTAFGHYFEPFLGSGAVFFDLVASGHLTARPATLLDSNPDLVGCYAMLRERVGEVMAQLATLADGHERDARGHYYDVRSRTFNEARAQLRRLGTPGAYTPRLAAALIYLNRTAYNGLFRLNSRGDFNVPLGRYTRPTICDRPNLTAVSQALSRESVRLACGHFADVERQARPGDFLYFDPPYAPTSKTSIFTAYTAGGFGEADQRQLQACVVRLARRGCFVVVSNSTAPLIRELYEDNVEARSAGLEAIRVPARRAINSDPSKRGEVLEYVITNVARRGA
ncbi:MAG: Dam family site-specific DNA-(adenine-N6)-methyltransferase [Vicinamibacterales bacterium]